MLNYLISKQFKHVSAVDPSVYLLSCWRPAPWPVQTHSCFDPSLLASVSPPDHWFCEGFLSAGPKFAHFWPLCHFTAFTLVNPVLCYKENVTYQPRLVAGLLGRARTWFCWYPRWQRGSWSFLDILEDSAPQLKLLPWSIWWSKYFIC